ncbi:MAG: aminotransferase class V-fold PLP-dependent enzyme [Ignavibacteria bacterium]|nr:aminotransferase class V-fold PLP-dependent enzyme [Ignavibacteria bacterium]
METQHIKIGLFAPSLSWQALLEQIGVAYTVLHDDEALLPAAFSALIVNRAITLPESDSLKEYCHKGLKKYFGENVIFNSEGDNFLPNIINVTFNHNALNVPLGLIPLMLDLKHIAVSGGSACSSGSLSPSKVLLEIGMDEETAQSSIRISVGKFNTTDDLDKLISALTEILKV